LVSPLREPVLVLNHQLEVLAATQSLLLTFSLKEEEIRGEVIYNLKDDHWNLESLHSLLEIALPEEKELKNVKVDPVIHPTVK
jgi:hypothetical protein